MVIYGTRRRSHSFQEGKQENDAPASLGSCSNASSHWSFVGHTKSAEQLSSMLCSSTLSWFPHESRRDGFVCLQILLSRVALLLFLSIVSVVGSMPEMISLTRGFQWSSWPLIQTSGLRSYPWMGAVSCQIFIAGDFAARLWRSQSAWLHRG